MGVASVKRRNESEGAADTDSMQDRPRKTHKEAVEAAVGNVLAAIQKKHERSAEKNAAKRRAKKNEEAEKNKCEEKNEEKNEKKDTSSRKRLRSKTKPAAGRGEKEEEKGTCSKTMFSHKK